MKKEIERGKVNRSITFKLDHQELAAKAREAGAKSEELEALESHFKTDKDAWKAKIKAHTKDFRAILKVMAKGEETRNVECVEEKDFSKNTVQYFHNKELVDSRPMQDWERQTTMLPEKKVRRAKPVDSDVAQVIKEETSRVTKKDASTAPALSVVQA